jgi:translation initiation factor IF-3
MSQPYKRKKPTLLVNDQIKAPTMLVLDDDGEQLGKMPRRKALEL